MRKIIAILLFLATLDATAAKQCGIISQACSAGPSTVLIDGMEVARPCWENTTQYACLDDAITSSCESPIAKGCAASSTTCQQGVTIDGAFQCITEQREYVCKVADATSSTNVNCGSQKFCVEGNCFDAGSVPDPDFAKAVTAMEVAREAGVYVDESTLQLFKGQDNRCSKTVSKNCCKGASAPSDGLTNLALTGGSAYVFDVLNGADMKSTLALGFDPTTFALGIAVMVVQQMLQCDTEEKLVAIKRDHRLCHYVGEYCSKKVNLVVAKICIQHKETYCCFNSKIAKIINMAARSQYPSFTWGTPENPSCEGISIAQFQALDFSAIDFSDFYSDIRPNGPDESAILNNAVNKVNSYFSN